LSSIVQFYLYCSWISVATCIRQKTWACAEFDVEMSPFFCFFSTAQDAREATRIARLAAKRGHFLSPTKIFFMSLHFKTSLKVVFLNNIDFMLTKFEFPNKMVVFPFAFFLRFWLFSEWTSIIWGGRQQGREWIAENAWHHIVTLTGLRGGRLTAFCYRDVTMTLFFISFLYIYKNEMEKIVEFHKKNMLE